MTTAIDLRSAAIRADVAKYCQRPPCPPLPDEEGNDVLKEYNLAQEKYRLPEIEDITTFLAKTVEKPRILIEGLLRQATK